MLKHVTLKWYKIHDVLVPRVRYQSPDHFNKNWVEQDTFAYILTLLMTPHREGCQQYFQEKLRLIPWSGRPFLVTCFWYLNWQQRWATVKCSYSALVTLYGPSGGVGRYYYFVGICFDPAQIYSLLVPIHNLDFTMPVGHRFMIPCWTRLLS